MRSPAALAMIPVLLLVACSTSGPTLPVDSPVDLRVTTDLKVYPRGGMAVITLRNNDEIVLIYNPCLGVMEVRLDDEWRAAPVNELEVTLCGAAALEIAPGQTVHDLYHLDPFHGPGIYRLRISTANERDRADIVIRSNEFRIE